MPLRDDLLDPIEGELPAGPNLYYDKVFDQLKEARMEEDDSIPSGQWSRAPKKADRPLVIKVAGETLAKRSKDLRLAGWYIESLVRREGFSQLPPSLDLLHQLQDAFWETLHPEREDDGDLGLRIGAIEGAVAQLATQLKLMPLTRGGINYLQYQDARSLGFETDATSTEKQAVREDAIKRGRLVAEDLQKGLEGTPKAFYLETEAALNQALARMEELDRFHEERYGEDYPSLSRLKDAVGDVQKVVSSVLAEKRKTEPDPVAEVATTEVVAAAEEIDAFAQYDMVAEASAGVEAVQDAPSAAVAAPAARRRAPVGAPTDVEGAFAQIAAAAEFLRTQKPSSAVPYLLCAALRMGELRDADFGDMNFAPAPSTETRQALRRFANEGNWDDLLQLALATLAEPCGRAWLDLQRYLWRAATERSYFTIASAVVSTVRGLLLDRPMLRDATLDDDTPAANAETQGWINTEVLPPEPVSAPTEEPATQSEPEPAAYTPPPATTTTPAGPPDVYENALTLLKQGRAGEAISLVVRDSEQQPSGRMRFQRRVQMAQLCLAADHAAVAYPVLVDLSAEMERRSLESWESAELLAQPLSLLLRCLDQRKGAVEDREVIFARLCRLDPQAALSVRR